MTTNTPQPPNVPVEMLNTIYNVADVGINTTKAGGWELVNFEHAACRVAQVVPDHTSTKEIFEGHGELIRCDHVDVDPNYGREMPCPSVEHLVEILANLYEDREKLDQVAQSCYERVTEDQFKWDNISDQFDGVFQEVLQAEPLVGAESVSPKKKGMCKKKRKKVPIGG
jgi:glycosyltransferase involved in cell wall biosynthesis